MRKKRFLDKGKTRWTQTPTVYRELIIEVYEMVKENHKIHMV